MSYIAAPQPLLEAEVLTHRARGGLRARRADSRATGGQGQRATAGLDPAADDAPSRSSAKPPPLAGVSPAPGALQEQEQAAHPLEGSMVLSAKGASGTCLPEVLPHASMPLARRTERTL
jgi:hypothetical protein